MSSEHVVPGYAAYWKAWAVLLAVTLAMVFAGHPALLAAGMALKAAVIALLFMNLSFERRALAWTVLLGLFLTAACLVLLLVPDGKAM